MPSPLSSVPVAERRRAAVVAAVAAVVLLVAGVLPWTRPSPVPVRVLACVALAVAALLALIAWGLRRSVVLDADEAQVDALVTSTAARSGAACSCGHERPEEMHVTDAPAAAPADCGSDACAHDCASCVLARRS